MRVKVEFRPPRFTTSLLHHTPNTLTRQKLTFSDGKITFKVMRYSLRKLLIPLLSYFLWKVMRYNIALLPKKVTNSVT